MRNVLLTGFEPFGGLRYNPAAEIVSQLEGAVIEDTVVRTQALPVLYGRDIEQVVEAIARFEPVLVLSLGLRQGASAIEVERFAVNLRTVEDESAPLALRREAAGSSRRLLPILPGGPAAYLATIPVEQTVEAIAAAGVPAIDHCYAGAYLCNHILYRTLHHLSEQRLAIPCGFLHLPHASEFLGASNPTPSVPLERLVAGVRAAIAENLTPNPSPAGEGS